MPTVEIPVPDAGFSVHHVEPHRVLEAADFNQLSGSSFPDSWLEQMVAVCRMMLNQTGADPAFLGFDTKDFGGSGPATFINTRAGIAIANNGIWPVPDTMLEPTAEAHFGHFEFSLEETLTNERSKRFYSIEREEIDNVMVPTSRRRFVRLYEKFNVSPEMTTTTPGRIRWLEYRKEAAFQRIISLRNWLTAGSSRDGFTTGDVKYSLLPGDGIKWLTCDGADVPREFQDLINFVRSASLHPAPLNISEVLDDGNGLCRLRFPGGTNLKNVRTHPGPGYACLEVLSSNDGTGFPPGTYKVKAAAGNEVTIALSFAGGSFSGTASFRPFSIADEDGGGARTPLPDFIRPYNPQGSADDANRLPNTYQDGQGALHDHGGQTDGGTPHSHPLNDPGHNHYYTYRLPEAPASPNYGIPTGPSGVNRHTVPSYTQASSTGITIGDETNHTHHIPPEGGADADNPSVVRPPNLSMYLLIKT